MTHDTAPAARAVAGNPDARPELRRESLGSRALRALATPGGAIYIFVAILLIAVIQANPNFGDPEFLMRFIGRTAPIAIAAIGQYFVIVNGEFDLSMGALVTAQVVLAGYLIRSDEDIVGAVALMVLLAIVVGVVNGLATAILKVPSFIVTLGTMLALAGLIRYQTGGAAVGNATDTFRTLGRGWIDEVPVVGVVPYSVLVLAGLCIAATVLMRRPFGRTLVATGDNAEAARLAGTSIWWLKTRAFLLSAFCATIAGILLAGGVGSGPTVGQGYEFTAITAVVLGGVVLGGGRGWVMSAVAGAFALNLLFILLTARGIPSTWQDTVQGVIIIIAVALASRAWRGGKRIRRRGTGSDGDPPPDHNGPHEPSPTPEDKEADPEPDDPHRPTRDKPSTQPINPTLADPATHTRGEH